MVSFRSKSIVYLLSSIAIFLWGMSYIWSSKLVQLGIPIEFFVFVRIFAAGLLLLGFNLISGQDIRIRKKDLGKFLLLAMFEPLIYFVFETYGIKLTESPTYSSLVIATTPIVSVVAGVVFFNERVNFLNIFGILVCLGGLFMVTVCASTVGPYFLWGILLLVVAVFAEVAHASYTKALAETYTPQVIVMYQFLFGAVYLLPLFLTMGLKEFEFSSYISWEVMGPILFLAIFCSSIAFSLWALAIKHLGVAKSSIFLAMIPMVTAVAGFLLGHEILTKLQWLGIIVACVGLIFSQTACVRCRKRRISRFLRKKEDGPEETSL